LTEAHLATRLEELAQQLDPVMQFVRGGTPVDRARLTSWFNLRRPALFSQFVRENLWPSLLAPVFNQHGGEVSPGFQAGLTNPNPGGTLYFTTDGRDPRGLNNAPQGTVYGAPITVESVTRIKARVFQDPQWSPVAEAQFTVRSNPRLVISEIMYHPPDSGATNGTRLEFIELRNVDAAALRLDGIQFSDGIAYTFASGTTLASGQYLVLASDLTAFADRYGGLQAFGQFEGNLDNAGERIALADPAGREILAFDYDDQLPWPTSPDGDGYSLVPSDDSRITDPDAPANWRVSMLIGGSPGQQDPASTGIQVGWDGAGVVLTWRNPWALQSSDDLERWTDVPDVASPLTVSIGVGTNQFWRLRRP